MPLILGIIAKLKGLALSDGFGNGWSLITKQESFVSTASPTPEGRGIYIFPDGSHFLLADNSTDKVFKYACPTPYSVAGADWANPLQELTFPDRCHSVSMTADGLNIYASSPNPAKFSHYALGTAYDFTTAGTITTITNVPNVGAGQYPSCMQVNADGTVLLVGLQTTSNVVALKLSTANDLTSYTVVDLLIPFTNLNTLAFNDDYSKVYLSSYQVVDIFEYSVDVLGDESLGLTATGVSNPATSTYANGAMCRRGNVFTRINTSTDTISQFGIIQDNYTAEYTALLNDGWTNGIVSPFMEQQALQSTLISDLKTAGVWAKLDLFYMFKQSGSEDFKRRNWINPATFDLVNAAGGSITFTDDLGVSQSGGGSLDSGYAIQTSGTNLSQNSISIGAKNATNATVTTTTCEVGANPGDAGDIMLSTGWTSIQSRLSSGSISSVVHTTANHFFVATRRASLDSSYYKDGVELVNNTTTASVPIGATSRIFLLASSGSGNTSAFHTNQTLEMAFVGGGLTNQEVADMHTAIQTYTDAII